MIPEISAAKARQLLARGAVLVDIRESDEHARSRIAHARHEPLSQLGRIGLADDAPAVIFHCRSGARTAGNSDRLRASTDLPIFILEGGIDGWRQAGLPIIEDRRQPIELMRQVQIAAGSLVVAGAVLGTFVHPGYFGLSAFVGAGLVFAGVTGTCAMARVLSLMPWNRRAATATSGWRRRTLRSAPAPSPSEPAHW